MVLCTTPLTYVVVKSTVLYFKSKAVLSGPIREAGNLQILLLLALTLQHFKILLHTLRYNFMKRKFFHRTYYQWQEPTKSSTGQPRNYFVFMR